MVLREEEILNGEGGAARGISVVIPSWNGRALLEKFLPSVVESIGAFEARCGLPAEIVVSDDASDDDTLAWLREHFPAVRCDTAKLRRGFAPTVNRGVRAAKFSWVYVLNNDVALEPNTLCPLIAHFDDPQVFAVSGQTYDFATGKLYGGGQWGEFRRGFLGVHERYFVRESEATAGSPDPKPYLSLWGSGGSTIYDRGKYLAVGGFVELFAPYGWEDVEICLKAWKQGFATHYEPRSAIWHQFSSTIGPRFGRRRVRAVYERNRLWMHWMHLDTSGQFAAHAGMVVLRLLADPFVLRWANWSALLQALPELPRVWARRKGLMARRKSSLVEVFERIAEAMRRPEVQAYREDIAPVRACPYSATLD